MLLFNSINPIYYSIAWTVTHSVWQILAIALGAGIILTIFQSKKALIRYNILLGAVALILLTSLFTFFYYYNLLSTSSELVETTSQLQVQAIGTEKEIGIEAIQSNDMFTMEKFNLFVEEHLFTIVIIWLVGMVMALLRLLGNISYVYYLRNKMNFSVDEFWENTLSNIARKLQVKKSIAILESALVRAPLVIGHLKPIILFPIGAINRLSTDDVEAIIAHELAHIKRNDYIVNICLNIAESIYYFHPAMWWLTSQISAEREHCCDDIAIDTLGSPMSYAKSLVAVQEMAYYSPQLAMAFASKENKSQLAIRVNRIFSKPVRAINAKEKGIASVFVLGLLILFSVAAKNNNAEPTCLPEAVNKSTLFQNKGSRCYLKFIYDEQLDSLYIPFTVEDGPYNYSDEMHHVALVVENRHVISFNLNGLEVAGHDIPKFQRLIETILKGKFIEAVSDDEADFNKDFEAYDHNQEQKLINEFTNELLSLGYDNKNTKFDVHFNAINVVVNRKTLTKDQHSKFVNLYERITNKEIFEDTGLAFDYRVDKNGVVTTMNIMPPVPDPPVFPDMPGFPAFPAAPNVPSKISSPDLPPNPPSPPKKGKNNSSSYSYSYTSNESDDTQNNSGYHSDTDHGYRGDQHGYSKKDEAFDNWLDKQLFTDGYIEDKNHFNYNWTMKKMTVNGILVSDAHREKYAKVRTEMTGYKMTPSFSSNRSVNND
jgi:beta-lactamase regulating signal transducer with metallopeptidase domain